MRSRVLSLMVGAGMVVVSWLGTSFATSAEWCQTPNEGGTLVGPDHPDSHRRGVVMGEDSPLPEWEGTASRAGLLVLAE